jgi:hypothetical protein
VTELHSLSASTISRLEAGIGMARGALQRPVVRLIMLALAAALFFVGGWYSFSGLAISPADLLGAPLLALALLTLPSLLYGGIGLILLARSSQLTIPLGKATVIGADAYLAELLPLPGGAIVRTGALMKAGGTIRQSSALVILTAILWIALGMIGAGVSLASIGLALALPLGLLGAGLASAVFVWLWRRAGPALAVQTLVHRAAGIALIALRLQFAFAALQVSTGFSQTLPFVLAGLIGSASSIAPAGLGVGESLAALVALSTAFRPETAFLAVGLDRVICLAACGVLSLSARLVRHFKGSA